MSSRRSKRDPEQTETLAAQLDPWDSTLLDDFQLFIARENRMERVFSPQRLLLCFTLVNFLNYFDRGAIAGVLNYIEANLHLDHTHSGMLAGAFTLGYMLFSPVFAHFERDHRPTRLMSLGLAVWAIATILTAATTGFWTLCMTRVLTGIGEASFAGLAPTCIDDNAPPRVRTTWLAIFYAMIPVGGACGYALGGLIAKHWHWTAIFFMEGLVMLPMCVVFYFVPKSRSAPTGEKRLTTARLLSEHSVTEMQQSGLLPDPTTLDDSLDLHDEDELNTSALSHHVAMQNTVWENLGLLVRQRIYVVIVLGYAAYTFVIGGFAYWIPDFLVQTKGMSLVDADLGIGLVTVTCGLLGTAIGGILLDRAGGSQGAAGLALSMKHATIYAVIGTPFAFLAFIDGIPLWLFFVSIGMCQLLLFCTTGPINSALLSSVPPHLRSMAMAISIFAIHLLGDMPSPILVGAISDVTGTLLMGMVFLALWLIWPILFWLWSWSLARNEARKNNMSFSAQYTGL